MINKKNLIFNKIFPGVVSLICLFYFFKTLFVSLIHDDNLFFLNDGDAYWIIKTGYWIIENKQIPFNNILGGNFSELNTIPLIAYQWLYEVIIAVIHKFTGFYGLIWFSAVLLTLTIATWGYSLYKRNFLGFPSIFLSLLCIFPFLFSYTNIRPFTATLFLGAVLNYLLLQKENKIVNWIIIPFLFVIWANIHLGFVFGLLWVFVEFCVKSKEKNSTIPFFNWLLCVLATLINPYGYKLYEYLANLAFSPFMNENITELQPVNFQDQPVYLVFIGLGIMAFIYLWNSNKVRFAEKIMWITSLAMFLFSFRHLCFFLMFMSVIIAAAIDKFVYTQPKLIERWRFFTLKTDKIFIWCGISFIIGLMLVFNKSIVVPKLPKFISHEFIQYLQANPVKNVILTNGSVGSELIYFTDNRSYIDTRFDMYGDKYVEKYTNLLYLKNNWAEIFKKENINYILYQIDEINKENIDDFLKNRWKILYSDKKVILLAKNKEYTNLKK